MSKKKSSRKFFTAALVLLSALSTCVLLAGATFGKNIFSSQASAPAIQKTQNIGPQDPIVITFKEPVATSNYRENIRIAPSLPFYAKWENNRTQLTLSAQNFWNAETSYTITLPEGETDKRSILKSADFTFSTIPYPKVVSITPENGAKDVLLDIEDPITLTLDRSSEDFFLDFSLSPKEDVVYQNNPEKTTFEILPQQAMKSDTTYTLTVSVRLKYDDPKNAVPLFTSTFTTLPPPPSEWSKDFAERLDQARRFTVPQIKEGKYIDINIEAQVLILFEDGKVVNASIVSSGRPGLDTPKGEYQIYNKHPRPWSSQYKLYMPYWMAITSDGKYGIHELPEWPGGYKEGQNHLGIPVSHGCVRLGIGDAEFAYNWADIGTKVIVH